MPEVEEQTMTHDKSGQKLRKKRQDGRDIQKVAVPFKASG